MWRILALAVLLSSCAQVTPFNGPSGQPAYSIACGMDRAACLSRAGELCPKGYSVIDRSASTAILPVTGGVIGGPQHTIAVECK